MTSKWLATNRLNEPRRIAVKDNIEGQYRQGDVLVMDAVDDKDLGEEIPRENGRVILAHGEVTGHAHALVQDGARLFLSKTSALKTHLRLVTTAFLRHEEHGEVPIKEKKKEIRIQRQWTTERIRRVVD